MNTEPVHIYARTVEPEALAQINKMAQSAAYKNCQIRIMPDCHAGVNSTIGTVIKINDKIIPNTVGVDIGCGMSVYDLGTQQPDLETIDQTILRDVPSGSNIHQAIHSRFEQLYGLNCLDSIDIDNAFRSIGTLGGGNHFIEVNKTEDGHYFLVIHSGSRKLGVQVCAHYQEIARQCVVDYSELSRRTIADLKAAGRAAEISTVLRQLKDEQPDNGYEYLSGTLMENYLHDMAIVQQYASYNRFMIATAIIGPTASSIPRFDTIHNYIDVNTGILRKGAVRADRGERLIIPINMRDGSLICIGKGNSEWLSSAPHGAGRLMSRTKAMETLSMEDFRHSMQGIYTTSVCESTLDEAPMVYKPIDEILECITPTVDVVDIIRPIYNFKARG